MTNTTAPLFYMTTAALDPRIASRATDVEWNATTHYYGTCRVYLDYENETEEGYGLVRADDDAQDREAEAGALYRAEMRHCL